MGQIKYTQQLIESLLLAEPYFEDIPIVRVDDKDLENSIEVSIKKIGVCVLIMMPQMTCEFPNKPGPTWLIKCACQAWEMPIINRGSTGTGKEASEIAEVMQATIHRQNPAGDGGFISDTDSVSPILKDEHSLVYGSNFVRRAGILNEYNQVGDVTILDAAGSISLACATAGNNIFYTTNGNNPGPQSEGSSIYTVPFSVSSGTRVKARAWIWGYTASDEATYLKS